MANSNHDAFTKKAWDAIVSATPSGFTRKARLMILTHSAYETGWGISKAYRLGRNMFNITRLPTSTLPIVLAGDMEYTTSGQVKKITQRFAAYPSMAVSVTDYLSFINRNRYKPALDLLKAEDVPGFLSALHKGGYFTLPLNRYLAGFDACLRVASESADRLDLK